MKTHELLGRLDGVKRGAGRSWQARCPGHDDRNPSLSITEGSDGRTLLNCHAGCTPDSVMAALGLKVSDLFADHRGADFSPLQLQSPEETSNVKRPVVRRAVPDDLLLTELLLRRLSPPAFAARRIDSYSLILFRGSDHNPLKHSSIAFDRRKVCVRPWMPL
jgi:hypothetical protein